MSVVRNLYHVCVSACLFLTGAAVYGRTYCMWQVSTMLTNTVLSLIYVVGLSVPGIFSC